MGIPIGSILVHACVTSDFDPEKTSTMDILSGCGCNQRIQKNSVILHAEMACLENAGRKSAEEYRECTIYTTLSPCAMCSGAIVLYGIKRVVIGENKNFQGAEDYLRSKGVEVVVLNDEKCIEMMATFIENNQDLWSEGIGK